MSKINGKPKDALHVAFVLDRSGSMSHLRDAVVSGVDEFVSELRRDDGETLLSLTAFDTRVEHLHVAVPLADIPSLRETGYAPGGMTALFDAVRPHGGRGRRGVKTNGGPGRARVQS